MIRSNTGNIATNAMQTLNISATQIAKLRKKEDASTSLNAEINQKLNDARLQEIGSKTELNKARAEELKSKTEARNATIDKNEARIAELKSKTNLNDARAAELKSRTDARDARTEKIRAVGTSASQEIATKVDNDFAYRADRLSAKIDMQKDMYEFTIPR